MAQNGNIRSRWRPNILVTGTPGTDKTITTSSALAEATQLESYLINEDLVCDELEDRMEEGGHIQTNNTVLYGCLTGNTSSATLERLEILEESNKTFAKVLEDMTTTLAEIRKTI
ncbi:hypothetical protein CJ030_MR4G011755 [Morella rubra]|uniref:Uncharacterized protein n=1 Tax=Morella rubra TaxID=262757 RepID=A0A6A1UU60_9ROSI|nr:hypothetical protein CJ030_MR8G016262 [Morella rubra]KAB1202590.1 hypothetical protein CJ030_MR8G016264 [Morella rubra]KAB1216331.1 hypothetical protein CJ030_MR4G011755 [Morella rubra]